jgi:hypothetical protein
MEAKSDLVSRLARECVGSVVASQNSGMNPNSAECWIRWSVVGYRVLPRSAARDECILGLAELATALFWVLMTAYVLP